MREGERQTERERETETERDRQTVIRQKTNNKNTNVGIFVVGILPNSFVGILFLMVTLVGIFV